MDTTTKLILDWFFFLSAFNKTRIEDYLINSSTKICGYYSNYSMTDVLALISIDTCCTAKQT